MNSEIPPALKSLLGDLLVSSEDLERLERARSSLLGDYNNLVEVLRHLKLSEFTDIYERLKGCTEHYSWVLNKAGKRYYYYYLKCKDQKPATIYIGKTPEGYNAIKRVARVAVELELVLNKLRRDLEELENTVKAFKEALLALGITKHT